MFSSFLSALSYGVIGKSTLAKILLRVADFDKGTLLVNGVDIRRYNPDDYHRHLTAVFQGFSKFNFTVQKNVGLGNVEKLNHRPTIEQAMRLAEADAMLDSLPRGLQTKLQTPGFESIPYPGNNFSAPNLHGLSGGEVRNTFCVGNKAEQLCEISGNGLLSHEHSRELVNLTSIS